MLVFNFGFADQHYGDVVANGIHAAALGAFQPLAAFSQIDRRFTKWADENLEEFWIHGHKADMLPQATLCPRARLPIVKLKILFAQAFTLVLLSFTIAEATTVQRLALEDLVKKAHYIVAGRVRNSRTFWNSSGKLILTTYTIDVDERIKGSSPQVFEVTTVGGKLGDVELHVSGMPVLEKDENVVLFTEPSGSYEVVLGLSQGKFKIENGEIFSDSRALSFADGGPGKAVRLPVETFKNQVRSILSR